ncbi:LysM peptidoglycan-binding domain-containing protein [Streptococcus sp. X16XC17]|uniref:CHAP domain-containing protein n=1 Tax=unclassified Streptococcus TaxID=2608887 RepID=UPI00069E7E68|nr:MULTISPECIES: LysM peptidoglycan-binding domain-containing protein [unclassified Streptococcus]TCD45561.1 LysM peptidoglycan-binding domain-containing protein [Streptococcus sp. X16XC17]
MKQFLGKATALTLLVSGGFFAGQLVQADSYTIQDGDSFYSIAQSYGIDAYELAATNGMGIYDLILPGQVLTLPGVSTMLAAPVVESTPQAATSSYTVQNGDSFSTIAAAHGMDLNQLAANNGMSIYDYIVPDQVLQVAAQATAPTATETSTSSYYLEDFDYEPGINYPIGQCTWAVQKLTGWAGDWWGNAADWGRHAAREGFSVGTEAMVGAIAVWDDGAYGHVAYVTDVMSSTQIQVLEANINGRQWIDNHRGWINPLNTTSLVTYIYPPEY